MTPEPTWAWFILCHLRSRTDHNSFTVLLSPQVFCNWESPHPCVATGVFNSHLRILPRKSFMLCSVEQLTYQNQLKSTEALAYLMGKPRSFSAKQRYIYHSIWMQGGLSPCYHAIPKKTNYSVPQLPFYFTLYVFLLTWFQKLLEICVFWKFRKLLRAVFWFAT